MLGGVEGFEEVVVFSSVEGRIQHISFDFSPANTSLSL